MARTHRATVLLISALLIYSISFSLVHKLAHLPLVSQLSDHQGFEHMHSDEPLSTQLTSWHTDESSEHIQYCALCSVLALHAIASAQFNLPVLTFVAFSGVSEAMTRPITVSRSLTQARAPPAVFFIA